MATKIQLRRDTEANWISNDPILAQGEVGLDLTNNRFKFGDGVNPWTGLQYAKYGDAFVFDNTGTAINSEDFQAALEEIDERQQYTITRTNKDSRDVFTIISFYRPDGTLARRSTLSNPNLFFNYETRTIDYYNAAGTAIILTNVFALTYDAEHDLINETVV
jgi:hypothetical protein